MNIKEIQEAERRKAVIKKELAKRLRKLNNQDLLENYYAFSRHTDILNPAFMDIHELYTKEILARMRRGRK